MILHTSQVNRDMIMIQDKKETVRGSGLQASPQGSKVGIYIYLSIYINISRVSLFSVSLFFDFSVRLSVCLSLSLSLVYVCACVYHGLCLLVVGLQVITVRSSRRLVRGTA